MLVGGSTVWLLRREQQRLQVQTAQAAAARQQALEDRAGLAAENLAVLLDEARDTLGRTLAQTPLAQPRPFLEGLNRSNSLVADVFGTRPDGAIAWGASQPQTRAWLRDTLAPSPSAPPSPAPRQASAPEMQQQLKAESNVVQYAQARSQLRELASANRLEEERSDAVAAFADAELSASRESSGARRDSPTMASRSMSFQCFRSNLVSSHRAPAVQP